MKRFIIVLITCLFSITNIVAAETGKANPRSMAFPELRFEIPKGERIVLECGMPVYLLQDSELPIVSISAMVHGGAIYEPDDKTGLAAMTGMVMRSGGAAGILPEKIDDELEFMASAVESGIASDMGTVSMTTLSRNLTPTLTIFSKVLLRPDFAPARVELARKHIQEALRRQNDDPKEIGDREINRAVYAGHPLGRIATVATVAAITRQDLINFHRRYFRPDNMILAVSGDFRRNEMIRELNAIFGKKQDLPRLVFQPIAPPAAGFGPETIYGNKEGSQAVIRMGHLGIKKDNPDIYAVRILDHILGGSFTSRLMMEIRTNRGLAYNVSAHFDVGRLFTGSFMAETETATNNATKTIALMKEIITGIRTEEISDQELVSARESIINSFMFGFTSPAAIANQRARLEFYGYPDNYLERYRANIAAVSKQDVLNAARKYLHPDRLKVVIIGDESKLDPSLTKGTGIKRLMLKPTK